MAAPLRLRKQIRKSMVKLLKGKTGAGDRVFPNAAVPPWVEELPVILIYPKTEEISKSSQAPREHMRVVSMVVEVVAEGHGEQMIGMSPELQAKGLPSCEDIIDDLIEEIDCEFSRDNTLGGVCDDHDPGAATFEFEGGGQKTVGSGIVTYDVMYHKHYPTGLDKQKGINDLKRTHTDFHVGHDDGAEPDTKNKEAEDDVAIPTE